MKDTRCLRFIYLDAIRMKTEKKLNKRLVGFIIWGTILGLTGLSLSSKGRGLLGRLFRRLGNLFKLFHDTAKSLGEKVGK